MAEPALTNWGKKDEQGKQVRIEHRTAYTRASRTAGISLRAQTKAAGINVTLNSQHGLRLSHRLTQGTQVALQNGRFVLVGRYGKGPHKLNLSKSGISVSTRNQLGTFNWLKPNRSSAKLWGIQVRGKKAAQMQIIYGIFSLIGQALYAAGYVLIMIINFVMWLILKVWAAARYLGHALQAKALDRRLAKAQTHHNALLQRRQTLPDVWTKTLEASSHAQLLASLIWILSAWGRGEASLEYLAQLKTTLAATLLEPGLVELEAQAIQLNQWAEDFDAQKPLDDELAILGLLGQQLAHHPQAVEIVYALDEQLIQPKPTKLQMMMRDTLIKFMELSYQPLEQEAI